MFASSIEADASSRPCNAESTEDMGQGFRELMPKVREQLAIKSLDDTSVLKLLAESWGWIVSHQLGSTAGRGNQPAQNRASRGESPSNDGGANSRRAEPKTAAATPEVADTQLAANRQDRLLLDQFKQLEALVVSETAVQTQARLQWRSTLEEFGKVFATLNFLKHQYRPGGSHRPLRAKWTSRHDIPMQWPSLLVVERPRSSP